MMTRKAGAILPLFLAAVIVSSAQKLDPTGMPRIGTVDERFQSYNIEMVEVTGGRFWKPYEAKAAEPATTPSQSGAMPAGISPDLFAYRPPIDLSNARLRNLAAALAPAYVRVSGTWANTVYFHDSDEPLPRDEPPAGFRAVLTRKQWQGVLDFTNAVNGNLMTSFAVGAGNRDADSVWTPDQARRLVEYTKAHGGSIVAAEFMNEPNYAAMGGAPEGYDAAAYARDVHAFQKFLGKESPSTLFLGPGSLGEGGVLSKTMSLPGRLHSEDLLRETGPVFEGFSFHLYAAVSQRCSSAFPAIGTTADRALSKEWLTSPDAIHQAYADLRDQFKPGKPLYLTETADAACGGNPWGKTFLDSFRYLNQNGRLAQKGVRVIAHNTLAASDYGLIDEETLTPRPDYWAAVLWQRLMGTTVLNPGLEEQDDLYVYAHCTPDQPGGVSVLAINAGATPREMEAPVAGGCYTLTADELQSASVQLNGRVLTASEDGSLSPLDGAPVRQGRVSLPATSITFVAFPEAGNPACQAK